MNENEERQLLTLLVVVTVVAGVAIAHSVNLHLKERRKRKNILAVAGAFEELRNSDAWSTATAAERKILIDNFTDVHIFHEQ